MVQSDARITVAEPHAGSREAELHRASRADPGRQILAGLGPIGHPRLRELTLTYSKPGDAALESMARSVPTAFPQLSWLRLEVNNHVLDSPSALARLAR